MDRAARLRRSWLHFLVVALALGLASSCGRITGRDDAGYRPRAALPPKPPPKPRPPAANAIPGQIVTVVSGDTVYGIARRHGAPIRTIIEVNDLRPPYILRVGRRLRLAPTRHHIVKRGETIYAISRLYDVDMRGLTRLNNIKQPYTIAVDQRVLLPGRVAGTRVRSKPQSPRPAVSSTPVKPARPAPPPRESAVAVAKIPRPPARAADTFAWPVIGTVISAFGPKPGGLHNDGINITGKPGAAVRAAANGVVAYAGNELRGFGNLLLVRHAGGWMTAYAHNEALHVRRGEAVARGQIIGRLGSTGHVTTPQLHFEIRKGSRAVDPLRHLARKAAALNRGERRAGRRDPG